MTADLVSNPINVSNHQPKPSIMTKYMGDDYLNMETTVSKIKGPWSKILFGTELTEVELFYMYVGQKGWVKTLGMYIADIVKRKVPTEEVHKPAPHGYIR